MPRRRRDSYTPRYEPYGRRPDRRRDDCPRENRPRENQDRRRGTGPGNSLVHRCQGANRDALALVPRMEERQYIDERGDVVAVDAVNRSSGGGRQNRIMAPGHGGSMHVKSDRPEHFAKAARPVKENTGADSVYSRMEPIFEDQVRAIRQDVRFRQLARESWGRPRIQWSKPERAADGKSDVPPSSVPTKASGAVVKEEPDQDMDEA
ncbi:hypothetical protein ACJZ2D_016246 [Fusarium nematophilum]